MKKNWLDVCAFFFFFFLSFLLLKDTAVFSFFFFFTIFDLFLQQKKTNLLNVLLFNIKCLI